MMPHIDCRVCQLPTLDELANMFLWRQQDCMKNSITMVALSKFSHNQLQGKNSIDKINMLADAGLDYYRDIPEHLRLGSFFRRDIYLKTLTDEELAKIPAKQRNLDANGKMTAIRSHVVQFYPKYQLQDSENKAGVLFNYEDAEEKR